MLSALLDGGELGVCLVYGFAGPAEAVLGESLPQGDLCLLMITASSLLGARVVHLASEIVFASARSTGGCEPRVTLVSAPWAGGLEMRAV